MIRLRSPSSSWRHYHRYTFHSQLRCLSDWKGARGHDLTEELLSGGGGARPKIVLHSFAPSGFDVGNAVKKVDDEIKHDGIVHMNSSILCFPHACFLWNVADPSQVTLESLSAVRLRRDPPLDYLFIGCHGDIPAEEFKRIQQACQPMVVEKLSLANAMGTFNILNAEDRQVAVALVLDPREDGQD